jgi:hypothetical protein
MWLPFINEHNMWENNNMADTCRKSMQKVCFNRFLTSTTMMRATAPPKQPGRMDGVKYVSNVDHITYGNNIEVQHQNGGM